MKTYRKTPDNIINDDFHKNCSAKFSLNFKDIEESIRCFDGKYILSIDLGIEDFKETASVLGWDKFQKYIFAKGSLKGLAKLFISGERGMALTKSSQQLEIEAECYGLVFYVVPSSAIDVDVVLGQPFCSEARVEMSSSGLKFEKIEKSYFDVHRIMMINKDETKAGVAFQDEAEV